MYSRRECFVCRYSMYTYTYCTQIRLRTISSTIRAIIVLTVMGINQFDAATAHITCIFNANLCIL